MFAHVKLYKGINSITQPVGLQFNQASFFKAFISLFTIPDHGIKNFLENATSSCTSNIMAKYN